MPRSDCVEWQGSINKHGYGVKSLGHSGRKHLRMSAHRWAWTQSNGPIPAGMSVLHRCDNPPCVNVEHLWLGTILDNNRDRAAKGRSAINIHPSPGEANGRALLTEARVREIRRLHETEGQKLRGRPRVGITRKQIAERFGVSIPTVDAVLSGRNWKGVMP